MTRQLPLARKNDPISLFCISARKIGKLLYINQQLTEPLHFGISFFSCKKGNTRHWTSGIWAHADNTCDPCTLAT